MEQVSPSWYESAERTGEIDTEFMMKKRILRVAMIAPAALALAGCSSFDLGSTSPDRAYYDSAESERNLEVPPDLAPLPENNHYQVPGRHAVSANAEATRLMALSQLDAKQGKVVQQTEIATLMKDGNQRWLRVREDASSLWPVVQDFWTAQGLALAKDDARTGYLETAWAENKANLPQDVIRKTLGKIADFAYSTGERDQYRCRIERNADGSSDIFITHRSMVEVLTGKDKESSKWVNGPTDPMLEVEMLRRLAVRIEREFNPTLAPKQADDVVAQDVTPEKPAMDAKVDAGTITAINLAQPFDRAWRTVNLALDRIGFDVADRDRQAGFFQVAYLDPAYEAKMKAERGFFSRAFSKDKAVETPHYRVQLSPMENGTRVTVLGDDGQPDTTGAAPRILNLLAQELR